MSDERLDEMVRQEKNLLDRILRDLKEPAPELEATLQALRGKADLIVHRGDVLDKADAHDMYRWLANIGALGLRAGVLNVPDGGAVILRDAEPEMAKLLLQGFAQLGKRVLVISLPAGAELDELDEETMREVGWIRRAPEAQ